MCPFCLLCVFLLLILSHCFLCLFLLIWHPSSPDPFVLQIVAGCELHSGKASAGFLRKAYQGTDLLSFQNKSWVPSPQGGSRAKDFCRLLNLLGGFKEIVHRALSYTCPSFLLSLLDAGKADIQQKGQSSTLPEVFPIYNHTFQAVLSILG